MAFEELFSKLNRSTFRARFKLGAKDARYLATKGLPTVLEHAREFLFDRLGAPEPVNDGSQTPMRGHPVFVAQHATATCCRGCLAKWHQIEKGRALQPAEIDRLVDVIGEWLLRQKVDSDLPPETPKGDQLSFF